MSYREIPYNYTSFSDKEIVVRILGVDSWQLINKLRNNRQTGLSAKMLFEVLGDIWIVRRNPYLQEDLIKNNKRLKAIIAALKHRLKQIKTGDSNVAKILVSANKAVVDFNDFLTTLKKNQILIKKQFLKITSSNNIRLDALTRAANSTDASDWRVEYPLVVFTPDTQEEVAKIVKLCIGLGLNIIARGGGTGYTGSGVPLSADCAIINTEKLLNISQIITKNNISSIAVGAGVVTKRVAEAANKKNLVFAVDPTSQDACTIGGNIAMNAGGKKAVRWGTTIDNLLSWKMVSPQGEWLEVIRNNHNLDKIQNVDTVSFQVNRLGDDAKTIIKSNNLLIKSSDIRKLGLGKDVTNKSLKGLPGVQKEGCDGIITSANFVLHKQELYTKTLCLEFFKEASYAVNAVVGLKSSVDNNKSVNLTGLEHLDYHYIKAVNYTTKANYNCLPNMVLLLDITSNNNDILNDQVDVITQIVTDYNGECFVAKNTNEQKAFWRDRANTASIAAHTNAFKINEDVVIPLDKLAQYSNEVERINIKLKVDNNLAALAQINDYLEQQNTRDNAYKEKYLLAKDLLVSVKDKYELILDNLDAKLTKGVLSFSNTVKKPLFDIYCGDIFKDIQGDIEAIIHKHKNVLLFVATHMHAGDGNVHTNIPVHSHIPSMLAKAEEVVGNIMAIATKLGGVISGEHGIGLTKFQYLSQQIKDDFSAYKQQIDPKGNFNRGKLLFGADLTNAWTPSLKLLEKEALILEDSNIGKINDMTKSCLRCGKCKPVCATHVPSANLLYSPRDKIIGSNLIIEAFLYEEQTRRGVSFAHFKEFDDIADHCTMCHRCAPPCPVNIDFGNVSIEIRNVLKKYHKKSTNFAGVAAMAFLNTNNPWQIKLAKNLLNITYFSQRLAYKIVKKYLQKKPNVTKGKPTFTTEVVTLLDKPLPNDTGLKPFRQLLAIENADTIPIIYDKTKETDNMPTVFYFPGCGSERLFSQIGLATIALLYHRGIKIVLPPSYLCCGYPQRANGDLAISQKINTDNKVLMHRVATTLNYLDIKTVLTSCGTCIDQLLDYSLGDIFADSKLLDIHEYLLADGVSLDNSTQKYLYHKPCHDPIKSQDSHEVISQIIGATVVDNDRCCGEAGTFASARPDIAKQVRFSKEAQIVSDLEQIINKPKADKGEVKILTTCPACRQGLSRYQETTGVEAIYPIEIIVQQTLGDNWQQNFIANAHIERVLL